MTASSIESNLVERAARLGREATAFGNIREVQQMAFRLDLALQRLKTDDALSRPFCITLLGGTGVGKSQLFNAILGRPEASATSSRRPFTSVPHIAVVPTDRPLLTLPNGIDPVFIDESLGQGTALCDVPDFDGMRAENWDVARAMVEVADLVVYVASPDNYANFVVDQEVRNWATRKRWYFVLNKLDLYNDEERERLQTDFERRLRQMGFDTETTVCFGVSAECPDRFDFSRFRSAIVQGRSPEAARLVRSDLVLGHLQHALEPSLFESVQKVQEMLESHQKKLQADLKNSYSKCLEPPAVAEAFRLVTLEAIWRQLSNRCGPFLALPVRLRCRVSLAWSGFQASRLLLRGGGPFGIVGLVITSVISAIRGLAPLRQVALALGPTFRRKLDNLTVAANRILEDCRLDGLVEQEPNCISDQHGQMAKPPMPAVVEQLLRSMTLKGIDDNVLSQLELDVERIGLGASQRIVSSTLGRIVIAIANAAPALMLGWILARIGRGWWEELYLPLSFYGMALALFAASLLSGFWLLNWLVRRHLQTIEAANLVEEVDPLLATDIIRRVADRLEKFVRDSRQLLEDVTSIRATLETESGLARSIYGAKLRNDVTPSVDGQSLRASA